MTAVSPDHLEVSLRPGILSVPVVCCRLLAHPSPGSPPPIGSPTPGGKAPSPLADIRVAENPFGSSPPDDKLAAPSQVSVQPSVHCVAEEDLELLTSDLAPHPCPCPLCWNARCAPPQVDEDLGIPLGQASTVVLGCSPCASGLSSERYTPEFLWLSVPGPPLCEDQD